MLVCHDLAGGYGEDRLVYGGSDSEFFSLQHWPLIDAFVYFSHNFVTIPPPGWINAAHRNDVPVLGTLITEWEEGEKRCRQLFSSAEAANVAAEKLASIARDHGFEGWLVNIENSFPEVLLPHLRRFLRALTAACRRHHSRSLVLWYDSITEAGELDWQNGLTAKNCSFFEACDGIFTNYTWESALSLEESGRCAEAVANNEARRQHQGGRQQRRRREEVYVGLDVFGRGAKCYSEGTGVCFGASLAKEHGLSVALFAPGWVYECGAAAAGCSWQECQRSFWQKLEAAWGRKHATLTQLPFLTHFCSGSGDAMRLQGRCVSSAPWYNLSFQDAQPSEAGGFASDWDPVSKAPVYLRYSISGEAAFEGGSCLELKGALQSGGRVTVPGLYRADSAALGALQDEELEVEYSVIAAAGCEVALQLELSGAEALGAEPGDEARGSHRHPDALTLVLRGPAKSATPPPGDPPVLEPPAWPAGASSIAAAREGIVALAPLQQHSLPHAQRGTDAQLLQEVRRMLADEQQTLAEAGAALRRRSGAVLPWVVRRYRFCIRTLLQQQPSVLRRRRPRQDHRLVSIGVVCISTQTPGRPAHPYNAWLGHILLRSHHQASPPPVPSAVRVSNASIASARRDPSPSTSWAAARGCQNADASHALSLRAEWDERPPSASACSSAAARVAFWDVWCSFLPPCSAESPHSDTPGPDSWLWYWAGRSVTPSLPLHGLPVPTAAPHATPAASQSAHAPRLALCAQPFSTAGTRLPLAQCPFTVASLHLPAPESSSVGMDAQT